MNERLLHHMRRLLDHLDDTVLSILESVEVLQHQTVHIDTQPRYLLENPFNSSSLEASGSTPPRREQGGERLVFQILSFLCGKIALFHKTLNFVQLRV